MAEAVPNPMTIAYAQSQYGDCLAKLEDARVASNISGQGNTWTPQSIAQLRTEASIWARTVKGLQARARGGSGRAAVAKWS